MKAKGQTHEWNSESRVRENRLHGLMRGRKRKRPRSQSACPRQRFSPTLLGLVRSSSMHTVSINLVVLRSPDIEKSAEFYILLGLQFTRHQHGTGPEHFAAELGGGVFELYPASPDGPSTLGTRIGFSVPSLDTTIAALSAYPSVVISPPKDSQWGRRAVISDPDGHRIELLQQ